MRTGSDCWGLGEIAFREGRSITLPPYNLEVREKGQIASMRALRTWMDAEVHRAWRKLQAGEPAMAYDAVVWGDHIAWVSEDPSLVLSTSEELKSSYLRTWPERILGAYRYVGPS